MRPVSAPLRDEAKRSQSYDALCQTLGYPADPSEQALAVARQAVESDPGNETFQKEYAMLIEADDP